jgi:NitT/TauT family transport system ATP-binding protein
MTEPALRFHGVAKTYDDGTEALQPIDLSVAPGELVALVGPSGCGKSSLLRIAAELEPASAGVVERRGTIGYVFQDANLLPWRSTLGNVELSAELEGIGRDERRRRATDALSLVGLEEFANHRPRALSGGMRMRASLARALVLEPDVFLFDEPFGALDEITRERLNEELLRLFELRRFAGLFVTHNVYEAVFCATEVVVMSGRPGAIVERFPVPFEFPRPPELRFTPEFGRLAGAVSATLRYAAGLQAVG